MQTKMDTQVSPVDEALSDVMMRIVSELYDVAYLIERIEPMLNDVQSETGLRSADSVKVLQGIDLAVQKTRGLAEFIDTVTGSIPQAWLVDITTAVNLVKLADMQRSLGNGSPRHGHSQPLTADAGDLEFF